MSTPPAPHPLHRDPVLRALLLSQAQPLPELRAAPDPFAALIRSVVGQQLSVKAAASIALRLSEVTQQFDAGVILASDGATLRAAGLSWAKVKTVQAIARSALNGDIAFDRLARLSDEDVIAALVQLPGIGRWTAEMFLMFALARPDVFSFGDLALRKALSRYYPGQDHPDIVRSWQPHRTEAARLLWRSLQAAPLS